MKYKVTEANLPQKMRRFLEDIDAGRAHCAPTLRKSRDNLASALRCLVETAHMKGLPLALAETSAEAMIKRLEAEGWADSSISTRKTLLRHYAYETGEGVEWALGSGSSDRRPIPLVLRAHHWSPYRALLPILIEQGISERIIRLADRWLRHRSKVGHLSLDHALQFRAAGVELCRLAEFMSAIDPGHPDTRILQTAQRKRRSTAKGVIYKPAYGELPEPFLSQMKAICRKPRELGGLSSARIKVLGCAIRRLLRSAKNRELGPELTMESARAFAEDLMTGSLKTISAAGYCDFLACFARRAGYPRQIVEALMQTHWALKAEAKGDLRRKEVKLAQVPVNLIDMAQTLILCHRCF